MNFIGEAILQHLNTLIVVISPQGEINYVSPSVQRLLGYHASQLLGNGWWELPRESAAEGLAIKNQVLEATKKSKGHIPIFERYVTTAQGAKKYIVWNSHLTENGNLVSIGYDISDRKQAEQLLNEKVKELQKKNAEMSESIAYAKRIQQSILVHPEGLNKEVADSFILYRPKDVVSGDLYWYYKKGNKLYVAAVDCTGHGVPGALMSVMAYGLLRNNIAKRNLNNPAQILYALDEELQAELLTQGTADGMDIALIEIDFETQKVQYAGAFRPLILIRNGQLIEFKASKFPIGLYGGVEKQFDLHEFNWLPGDALYLFSDGYADQFGGERNKKFNRKNFYETLLSIQDMTMEEQASFLEYTHNNWKQNETQTDDILVMGIKL
ncbi:MAG: SpoIIE family protein phosphatase [Bacteroidetes bacterium]|nr:SpoIIE family protein phosphatase [Bacteroidota bacterium]